MSGKGEENGIYCNSALLPETRGVWGRAEAPPKYRKLKRIPMLGFEALMLQQSSYSALTQSEQKYYTETTWLAAEAILLFIQVVINRLMNERGVKNLSWRRPSSVGSKGSLELAKSS